MSVLQNDLPGARVLDLFAGSGALGLEALSRGAAHATFVEKAPAALRVLEANIAALDATRDVRIIRGDALRTIETFEPLEFDIAFADPPYESGAAARIAERFIAVPFARILSVEHSPREQFAPHENMKTRRYGDTALTFLMAPQ